MEDHAVSRDEPTAPDTKALAAGALLTVKEAAAYLRVSKSYVDKLRVSGDGPEYMRLGKRKILYATADLEAWAASRRHRSTSEYAA